MKTPINPLILVVNLLIMCLPQIGRASEESQKPKTFAVFTAHYNRQGGLVRGGVCGTVFFVSPTRAITAYHVLQARSFQPMAGFERVRVWLVHEGVVPIELNATEIQTDPGHDITSINLNDGQQVASKFVYNRAQSPRQAGDEVETDGFVADTAGPTLIRDGEDIRIIAVPHLQRLHLEGHVVRQVQVSIEAKDLHLQGSPEVQLSYQPVVGISGGPVVSRGEVVAMNSFADPETFKQTWALSLTAGLAVPPSR